jgi:protein TonB
MELRIRTDRPGDRLATAFFLAALAHGLLILGVRFTAPPPRDLPLPTLEVLLVPDGRAEPDNPRASYIAERSQHGSGTARDNRRTSLPESSASMLEHSGEAGGDSLEQEATTAPAGEIRLLSSSSMHAGRTTSGAESSPAAAAVPLDARPLTQVGANAAAAAETLRLKGDPAADDRLLADTRESLIAAYLDGWKRHIERVGTLNFPDEALRRAMSGNPVLEVAIGADGRLVQAVVRRTSGHRELDNAALRIVRLAAPFDPFPRAMRERYPVLRFAYEWQFLEGRLADSAVYTDGP